MRLNDEQLKAATTLRGNVIVDAGAGSGKTRAMTQRFVNATNPDASIPDWEPASVDSIVAITFTEKAAGELAERIRLALYAEGQAALARRIDAAFISTIHGFCSRVLREHAVSAGLDPLFAQADEVLAAQLSEAAFDTACRAALHVTPVVEQLLDEHGYDNVRVMVLALSAELTKKAASTEQVDVETACDLRELAEDALVYFSQASCDLEACGDKGKTVPRRIGECQQFVHEVKELLSQEVDPETFAARLLGAATMKNTKTGTKASGDLLPQTSARAQQIREQARTFLLQAPSTALIELVARYREAYAEAKRERGVLDFDDLQVFAASLLSNEAVAARYRDRFSLVMVDEFQDTDALQLGIISKISRDNLFTVGDERQSIYRFRGADVDVYRRHRAGAVANGVEPITFSANYRSHQAIIGFVNRVFGSERFFGDNLIRLKAERLENTSKLEPDEPRIDFVFVDCDGNSKDARKVEAEHIAQRFASLRDRGYRPNDMVVLKRTWANVDVYAHALREQGFDVVVGGGAFFKLGEVRLVTMLARAIANPHDEEALAAVLASPLVGLSADGLWRISRREAEAPQSGLWTALRTVETFSAHDASRARTAAEAIEQAGRDQLTKPLSAVLMRALEDLDYDLVLFSEGAQGQQELGNILKLLAMADAFEAAGGAGMAGFVGYLGTRERLAGNEAAATLADDGSPAVRIMTMHGSKGLEFPVVAAVDLSREDVRADGPLRCGWVDDRLEIALKAPAGDDKEQTARFERLHEREKAAQSEEAKRLLYVAATRAEDVLILSGLVPHAKFAESKSPLAVMAATVGVETLGVEPVVHEVAEQPSNPHGAAFAVRITGVPVTDQEAGESESLVRFSDEGWAPVERPHAAAIAEEVPEIPSPLSYSALAAYKDCPYSFWVQRVLRAGVLEDASNDGADALGFGSAVHAALQLSISLGEVAPPQRLDAIARYHSLSEEQASELHTAVENFMSSDIRAEVETWGIPRPEVAFTVPVGSQDGFLLAGAMDLVAQQGDRYRVVDYKTGIAGGPEELGERYEVQARCYAYALLVNGAAEITVTVVRPQVVRGGRLERVSFGPYGPDDIDSIERELLALYHEMREGAFPARPERNRCGMCSVGPVLCENAYGRAD